MWTGLVLVGGRSTRMGRDKASLSLRGSTLLERAVRSIRDAGGRPLIIGPSGAGVEGVPSSDETAAGLAAEGPLPALRHGLSVCGTPRALALACDMPLVPPALLRHLVEALQGHDAVVPRVAGELQVLCAAYTAACAVPIDAFLRAGGRAVHLFLEGIDARILDESALQAFGGAEVFLNVNTPEDLARADAALGGRA